MRQFFHLAVLVTTLLASGGAWAAALRGSVMNGTTNQPAVGDEVVLLTLSNDGMSKSARVKTDGAGSFVFKGAESPGSRVVRVVHQGVTYHSIVPADGKRLEVRVYDVTEKLGGVSAVMDVQRFEATEETLEIKQLVTMRNDSKPPRTLMNDRPSEIQLPPNAKMQSGLVQFEDGQPLKQNPVADEQGQYHFVFPLRPGDTRFAVVYRVPYTGEALIDPKIRDAREQFVIMLPKSMKFEPKTAGIYKPRPGATPDHVEGTGPVTPGQTLAFRISGTGMLEELQGSRKQAQDGQAESKKERPGGGLGAPIDAPDPLHENRWQILAGLTVLLVAGALSVARKTRVSCAGREPVPWRVPTRSLKKQAPLSRNDRHRRRVRASQESSH